MCVFWGFAVWSHFGSSNLLIFQSEYLRFGFLWHGQGTDNEASTLILSYFSGHPASVLSFFPLVYFFVSNICLFYFLRGSDGKMRLPEPVKLHSLILHQTILYPKLHSVLLLSDSYPLYRKADKSIHPEPITWSHICSFIGFV